VRSIVVALSGPSGAGKSTTAAQLGQQYGWAPLPEAYDRLRPRPALTWASETTLRRLELRLLREEARRFGEARSIAATGRTVIADTSFLDPVEYTAGLRLIDLASPATFDTVVARARALVGERRLGLPDLTVQLAVSAGARRGRAARDPRRHPPALRPRHEAVGRAEESVLVPTLRRLFPRRFAVVDGTAPPATAARRIALLARTVSPLPDPFRAAARALEAIDRAARPRAGPGRSGKVKKGVQSPRLPR